VRDIEASTVTTLPGRSHFWQNEAKQTTTQKRNVWLWERSTFAESNRELAGHFFGQYSFQAK
jgi:hypothetical protein